MVLFGPTGQVRKGTERLGGWRILRPGLGLHRRRNRQTRGRGHGRRRARGLAWGLAWDGGCRAGGEQEEPGQGEEARPAHGSGFGGVDAREAPGAFAVREVALEGPQLGCPTLQGVRFGLG